LFFETGNYSSLAGLANAENSSLVVSRRSLAKSKLLPSVYWLPITVSANFLKAFNRKEREGRKKMP